MGRSFPGLVIPSGTLVVKARRGSWDTQGIWQGRNVGQVPVIGQQYVCRVEGSGELLCNFGF